MKKNITINLFGTLYNIDEDAYQMLNSYLESMKRYFGNKNDDNDIADDIEHRVAELLWEKKEQGIEAINIDIIKEIIGKIGNAEQIADNGHAEQEEAEAQEGTYSKEECSMDADDAECDSLWQRMRKHFAKRALFRDGDDMLIGGVCSGIAHYLGIGGPILWRLLLIVLFIMQGVGLLLYLVLWIIIPMARKPEDKLRMKGIPLSPENINKQIFEDHKRISEQGTNAQNKRGASGCLLYVFAFLLLGPIALTVLGLIIAGVITIGIVGSLGEVFTDNMIVSDAFMGDSDAMFLTSLLNTSGIGISIVLGCVIVILLIIFYLIARWMFGSNKPMRTALIITLATIIIGCLACGAYFTTTTVMNGIGLKENIYKQIRHNRSKNTNFTFKAQPELDVPYLELTGFNIITNNTTRCTWKGDYPNGDYSVRYLDACNYDELIFTATKTDSVAPGSYSISALVRAEAPGAFLYVKVGKSDNEYTESMQAIPANDNRGGNLWKWACGNEEIKGIENLYPKFCTDSARTSIAMANDKVGFGWSLITIKGIKVKNGETISYGITTDYDITGVTPECSWVSATDFVLTKE